MENCASNTEEKRNTRRVQKLFMIAYLPKENGPSRTLISLGRTLDISPSGVGMEIYKEVAVGTVMEMEIDLYGITLPAFGKVVRVDPMDNGNFLIGIRFDEEQELLQTKIALTEITSLRQQKDELEAVLTTLVKTGWPWDNDGRPNEIFYSCPDGFAPAMITAKKLLGQSQQSMIHRTELES